MIRQLLEEQFRPQLPHIATDYLSVVVSCVDVPWAKTYQVTDTEAVRDTRVFRTIKYKVIFSPTGTLSSKKIKNCLNAAGHEVDWNVQPQITQALNVILAHVLRKESLSFGAIMESSSDVFPGSDRSSPPGYIMELLHHRPIKTHVAAARVLIHVETRCIPYHHPGPLSAMIKGYMSRHQWQMNRLENMLRGVWVHITPPVRNYQGQNFGTIIQIRGLASTHDGALLQHPPKVARYGAGPQEVEIYIEPRQILGAASPFQRGYATLMVFFEQGWPFPTPHDNSDVANQ